MLLKPQYASKMITALSYFSLLEYGRKVEAFYKITKYLFSLEEILKYIQEAGFEITQMKEIYLNEEETEKIYSKIKNKDFYKDVLEMLSE